MTDFSFDPVRLRRTLSGVVSDDLDDRAIVERYATAVWSGLAEPGDGVAGALVSALGPDAALRGLIDGDLARRRSDDASAAKIRAGLDRWRPRLSPDAADRALQLARLVGARLVTPDDDDWPDGLADLGVHAPLCLWVRGRIVPGVVRATSVALVGARAATAYGAHVTAELAADLAGSGIAIVSGAAYGIDGAAHRAVLAADGTTVAFLAGGADRPYPAGHVDLIEQIASTGAIISEVPCGGAPSRWRFLQRNRLIAALSGATVVVEAGTRSGSLNTAGHAASLGRGLGAVPGSVLSAASAGCHRLLREYDAQCITNAQDVRELLGIADAVPGSGTTCGEDTRIVDALSTRAWRTVDDVARRSGRSPTDVETSLGLLALDGAVERGEQGWRYVPTARR